MRFVDKWVHEVKTPVPFRSIVDEMRKKGIPEITTRSSLNSLMKKGYLRRAVVTSNKTFYVQLKRV